MINRQRKQKDSNMPSKTRTRKPRLNRDEVAVEALSSALAERSVMNYEAIFKGFIEKGISAEQIVPRENVFTYNAWRALGRQVRKGEHGVLVVTWITSKGSKVKTEGSDGEGEGFKFPRTVSVFHITQTDPVQVPAHGHGHRPCGTVPCGVPR
jgi:hypothetical protein